MTSYEPQPPRPEEKKKNQNCRKNTVKHRCAYNVIIHEKKKPTDVINPTKPTSFLSNNITYGVKSPGPNAQLALGFRNSPRLGSVLFGKRPNVGNFLFISLRVILFRVTVHLLFSK